jgi:nucleotide-binding universal stress UspA family protein
VTVLQQCANAHVSLANVLLATDFSAAAGTALPYAVAVCRRYQGTLHIANAIPELGLLAQVETVSAEILNSGYETVHRAALERMTRLGHCMPDVPHRFYVRRGNIWNTISEILAEQNIDLLVLGTHGRSGLGKVLIGSVAEEILRQAACPVLTVGPHAGGLRRQEVEQNGKAFRAQELEVRNIIFATDFSPGCELAARLAISLAEDFQARLGLIHALPEHGREQANLSDWAAEHLQKLVPAEATLPCTPETIVKVGPPAECILQASANQQADLIILGVRPSGPHLGAATHLPWAVVHKVVAHACCPVVTVRHQ